MDNEAQSAADRRGQIGRKIKDLAALAPILGVVLFASPLISAVTGGADSELPNVVLYIFAAWGVLIIIAFVMSLLLRGEAGSE